MDKQSVRQEMRTKLRSLSHEEIARKSTEICKQFENSEKLQFVLQKSENLAFYMPLSNEVDVTPLLLDALREGRNCYLPRVIDDGNMEFFKIDNSVSLESQLESGCYGILEPLLTLERLKKPFCYSDFSDMAIIVPGLAFGRDFTRIGKGKGYYDRFFEKLELEGFKVFKIAVCFDCQLLDSVPHDKYDRKVDTIVTESQLIVI